MVTVLYIKNNSLNMFNKKRRKNWWKPVFHLSKQQSRWDSFLYMGICFTSPHSLRHF